MALSTGFRGCLILLGAAVIFSVMMGLLFDQQSGPASSGRGPIPTKTAEQLAQDAERKHIAALEQERITKVMAAEEAKWLRSKAGRIWQKHKTWNRNVCDTIADGQIELRMTTEQCRLSWGNPTDINRTVYSFGVHEQWCYGEYCKPALYFEDGILISWQD